MQEEPNVTEVVPFFGVSDMQASLRFYVDGLSFSMKNHWMDEGVLRWCWLQIGAAGLMLQEYKTQGQHAFRPQGKLGEGVNTIFLCRDALAIYHAAVARGIAARKPFVGNGMWVTSMTDPDGYRIDFESLTDAPEGSVYGEG